MNKPSIITLPNKKLRNPTKKVEFFDEALKTQINEMTKALRHEGGVGLAANQLGYENKVLIVECAYKERELIPLTAFINPEISNYSEETDLYDEGCLSIPPIELETERAKKIKIKYRDEQGKLHKITAKKFLARILQHEIDHLNGIMFTDRVRDKYLKDFPELKKTKIVFIGSDEFAKPILEGMIALGLNVSLVITEAPKPAGRNRVTSQTLVSQLCKDYGKNLIETLDINKNIADIKKINPDLIILADFGQLLPKEILTIPALGALNLHPSLLPKYRGATPIQTAILSGEKETGVTLMKMSEKFDTGPIMAQIRVDISGEENSAMLEKSLSVAALKLLYYALPRIINNTIKEKDQNAKDSTSTHKFKKEEGEINWTNDIYKIDRQIKAFYPWPGTYTFIDSKRLIIHAAHIEEEKIVLDIVQPEGKKPMTFSDFMKGFRGQKPNWFKKIKI